MFFWIVYQCTLVIFEIGPAQPDCPLVISTLGLVNFIELSAKEYSAELFLYLVELFLYSVELLPCLIIALYSIYSSNGDRITPSIASPVQINYFPSVPISHDKYT